MKIINMVKVYLYGLMVEDTKDNLDMENKMVREW